MKGSPTSPDGAEVVVLPADHDEPFDLDDARLRDLATRVANADRGDVESGDAVLAGLRRAR